jgi:hypothetical protein
MKYLIALSILFSSVFAMAEYNRQADGSFVFSYRVRGTDIMKPLVVMPRDHRTKENIANDDLAYNEAVHQCFDAAMDSRPPANYQPQTKQQMDLANQSLHDYGVDVIEQCANPSRN